MTEEKTTIDLTKLKEGDHLTWRRESKDLEYRHGASTFVCIHKEEDDEGDAMLRIKNKHGATINLSARFFDLE